MRKEIILPGLALGGGLAGFGLRRWQWLSAYDAQTQLYLHGAPATFALLALTALLVLAFLVLCRGKRRPEGFLDAFFCPSPGFMGLMAASGFCFLGAGLLGLLEWMDQFQLFRISRDAYLSAYPAALLPVLLLTVVLTFGSGAALLLVGRAAYRGQLDRLTSLLSVLPGYTGLCWLFATHLLHGTAPVAMRYGFSLAATILMMLCHYFAAGFFFGRSHPQLLTFCASLGISLGIISLADGPSWFQLALTAAFLLSLLGYGYALLSNNSFPAGERMPSGAEREESSIPDEE